MACVPPASDRAIKALRKRPRLQYPNRPPQVGSLSLLLFSNGAGSLTDELSLVLVPIGLSGARKEVMLGVGQQLFEKRPHLLDCVRITFAFGRLRRPARVAGVLVSVRPAWLLLHRATGLPPESGPSYRGVAGAAHSYVCFLITGRGAAHQSFESELIDVDAVGPEDVAKRASLNLDPSLFKRQGHKRSQLVLERERGCSGSRPVVGGE